MQPDAFLEEAYELLGELENALLELEETPQDADLIDRVFRAMHTIKGSGAMFGFDAVAGFTHELETVFDRVREGKLQVNDQLISLTLSARDHIKNMLDAGGGDGVDQTMGERIIRELHQIDGQNAIKMDSPRNRPDTPEEGPGATFLAFSLAEPAADLFDIDADMKDRPEQTYRIRFKPPGTLFTTGTNPLLLLEELRAMGPCTVVAQTDDIPDLAVIDPEACYLFWDIVVTTAQDINAIKDVFIFVEDDSQIDINPIEMPSGDDQTEPATFKKLGEILVERGDLSNEDLLLALSRQKRIGQVLMEDGVVAPSAIGSALAEQAHIRQASSQQQTHTAKSTSLRVTSEKLDVLVDLVGELVTMQARLSQKAATSNDADLLGISETVERLTAELRDNALSIRMLPIGSTFSQFKRLVRDLSAELHKDVALTTSGGETELDKTVIEQLNDPLVHIIRNSIDHGIESPAEREAAGKPRQGCVHLSAEHAGANVLISIRDDGAGLNPKAIREKAVARGLIPADAVKSDKELFGLIFAPGFSTARQITSVSGRGVGMDVVKRGIESLRGSIDISSEPGNGTVITLKLPLTLAIIDGLLVEISGDKYVLPLAAVEECVELTRDDLKRANGRNIISIRGLIVPFISLREHFAMPGQRPDIEQVIINEVNGQQVGIVVDRVIGERQIVIKTMSPLYQGVEEISGATILGDGTVALILDVRKLLNEIEDIQAAA